MRVIFFGSPEFSCPTIRAIAGDPRFEVVMVVTQPDSRSGRGQKVSSCAGASLARELELTVHQPVDVNSPDSVKAMAEAKPDMLLTAAYGQKLSDEILALPTTEYALNLHASLLPRHRGASPVHHAIKLGDSETGVTLMGMTSTMDGGAIYAQKTQAIQDTDTAGTLEARLSEVAAELIVEQAEALASGSLKGTPQAEADVTFAPQLRKEHGKVSWDATAAEIDRHIRGMTPWPGAFTFCPTDRSPTRLTLVSGEILDLPSPAMPGTVVAFTSGIEVATKVLVYRINEVKRSGKRALPAVEFLRGFPLPVGTRLQ